jgi:hypothetical protein
MPLVIILLFFFVDTFPVASGHCGVVLYEVVTKGRLTKGGEDVGI